MALSDGVVRAAGGIVTRPAVGGGVEVLLVHRPAYDDWTFPKGKARPGESAEACALREVREETGLACRLGPELPSTSYRDQKGRPKVVRYFAMEPLSGEFTPHTEIDEIRWVDRSRAAAELLSYEHDRALLAEVAGAGGVPRAASPRAR